jgi:hypothetical protein
VVTVLAEAVAIATLAAAVAGEVAVAAGVGSTAAGATVTMGDALCVAAAGADDELKVLDTRAPDVATTYTMTSAATMHRNFACGDRRPHQPLIA